MIFVHVYTYISEFCITLLVRPAATSVQIACGPTGRNGAIAPRAVERDRRRWRWKVFHSALLSEASGVRSTVITRYHEPQKYV